SAGSLRPAPGHQPIDVLDQHSWKIENTQPLPELSQSGCSSCGKGFIQQDYSKIMKTNLFILICLLISWNAAAQMAIHDRAIVAQQERMVYKEWDRDKFYPKPNRILGVPTILLWYMTWALHPNYP